MTSLASLSLFPATPEQTIETRRRSFASWAGNLTLEQFLARDARMDTFEQATEGRFITWVLAPRNDPQSLDFFCSCESFRRNGVVWKDGVPQEVTGYAIASVFTPAEKRGHGYARYMMRLLHWVLADHSLLTEAFPSGWGDPPSRVSDAGGGWFSTLWSDVGRDFYRLAGPTPESEGWLVRGAYSTFWDVPAQEAVEGRSGPTSWTWLGEDELTRAWQHDAKIIASEKRTSGSPISFAFLPGNGVAAFQHRRLDQALKRDGLQVDRWGIIKRNASETIEEALSRPDAVFATWMFELHAKPKTLLITRVRSLEQQFPALLKIIMEEARRYNLPRIEIYNLPEHLQSVAESLGSKTIEREEHLPSFKWYGSENSEDVRWLLNERFCWC